MEIKQKHFQKSYYEFRKLFEFQNFPEIPNRTWRPPKAATPSQLTAGQHLRTH